MTENPSGVVPPPPKFTPFVVRMPPHLYSSLRAEAAADGRSIAATIRWLVEGYILDREEQRIEHAAALDTWRRGEGPWPTGTPRPLP